MRRLVIVLGAVAVAVAALLFSPVLQHWRTQSPDGTFAAVTHTQPFYLFIPMMPGGGSDKPGTVTVYRGGQSCGSAWVPMVSFIYDIRWELDARPRRAQINLVAAWNLDDCSMKAVG